MKGASERGLAFVGHPAHHAGTPSRHPEGTGWAVLGGFQELSSPIRDGKRIIGSENHESRSLGRVGLSAFKQ